MTTYGRRRGRVMTEWCWVSSSSLYLYSPPPIPVSTHIHEYVYEWCWVSSSCLALCHQCAEKSRCLSHRPRFVEFKDERRRIGKGLLSYRDSKRGGLVNRDLDSSSGGGQRLGDQRAVPSLRTFFRAPQVSLMILAYTALTGCRGGGHVGCVPRRTVSRCSAEEHVEPRDFT